MASSGRVASIVTPSAAAGPARRLALTGAAVELVAAAAMEWRLGALGRPYHAGRVMRMTRTARALTIAGGAVMALAGQRRCAAAAGAMSRRVNSRSATRS